MRYMCRASSLKRAEQLRDKAVELNNPDAGGYVALPPSGLPICFLQFKTPEIFNQWKKYAAELNNFN